MDIIAKPLKLACRRTIREPLNASATAQCDLGGTVALDGSVKSAQIPARSLSASNGSEPTILLFGDSHSMAVHWAVERRLVEGRSAPLAVLRPLKEKSGLQIGNISFRGFLERISQLGPNDVVLSAIGGSQHAVFSTIQHREPFDFYTPDDPTLTDGVELIPYRALRASFAEAVIEGLVVDTGRIKGDGPRLEAMRKATSARVMHLIPPPPTADNESIARRHEAVFADGIGSLGVSPPDLRRKFWLLQARILQNFCRNRGIEVMMPPPETTDAGFLRPEYHHGGAHANWRYGELLLRSVEAQFLPNKRATA